MDKIVELLVLKGYTQKGFERAAGLSENRISKWKSGLGEPSIWEAARMAKLLEISLDDLVDAKKIELPISDLTEDERLVVTVMRKAQINSGQVIQRLFPEETGRVVVKPRRPRSPGLRKAK